MLPGLGSAPAHEPQIRAVPQKVYTVKGSSRQKKLWQIWAVRGFLAALGMTT